MSEQTSDVCKKMMSKTMMSKAARASMAVDTPLASKADMAAGRACLWRMPARLKPQWAAY